MAAPSISLSELEKFRPCADRLEAIKPAFKGCRLTARQAVKAGATLKDIVWIAAACARNDKDVERRIRMWMADCAARVLHIYEKEHYAVYAPRDAIIAARAYASGEIGGGAGTAARDASGAARDAAWYAARAASGASARDASGDARGAAWHAAKAASWASARDASGAARDAAWYAAKAASGAARAASKRAVARDAAWAEEERWQRDRLVAWLSGREPKPLALPPIPKHMQEVA